MFLGLRVKEVFFNYMTDYDKRQNSFALSQFSFCPSKEEQTANKMSVLINYSNRCPYQASLCNCYVSSNKILMNTIECFMILFMF